MYKKNIAVFVSHVYGDYQKKLCRGLVKKAAEYDCRVDIFTSNDGENLGEYGTGEHSILQIPNPASYAGVVFASDTYLLSSLKDEIRTSLNTRFSCPVIEITQQDSSFPRIMLENNSPVKDLVIHLHSRHNCRQIYYISYQKEHDYDALRFQSFCDGLRQVNPKANPQRLFYNEDTPQLRTALQALMTSPQKPDAFVCYNDKIATLVIICLKEMGCQIPRDVAVTGCDTLDFGQKISPTLTSITFPIEEIGQNAIYLLSLAFQGLPIPPLTVVTASISFGTSCGCETPKPPSSYFYCRELDTHIASLEKNLLMNMHMSASLQGIKDLDQGMQILTQFTSMLPEGMDIFICLYENWYEVPSHISTLTQTDDAPFQTDQVFLKLAMKGGKRLPECTFRKPHILPDFLLESFSSCYIYSALFFSRKCFGYIALSSRQGETGYPLTFIPWLMNVSTMLKDLNESRNLDLMVERLEYLHSRDELTGLLNRQGFHLALVHPLRKALASGAPILAIVCDLQDFSRINDTYGPEESSFALQVLAHAMESALSPGDLLCRQDICRFHLLSTDATLENEGRIMHKIRKYLENYNRLNTKSYAILARFGFSMRRLKNKADLDTLYEEATASMGFLNH